MRCNRAAAAIAFARWAAEFQFHMMLRSIIARSETTLTYQMVRDHFTPAKRQNARDARAHRSLSLPLAARRWRYARGRPGREGMEQPRVCQPCRLQKSL